MLISDLKDKKILILGFGREGQDSFLFLRKHFPEKALGIADQKEFEELPLETQRMLNKDNKVVLYFGPGYLVQLNTYDVVLKAPGIPLRILKPYLKKEHILTSQTNIFFANCPGTIIGVTGTKGKSTTTSLIYEVLTNDLPAKKKGKVYLIGNIEQPVLRFLDEATKDHIFVYELSSFQLETATASPHIALLLNIYPEHLDHHESFKAYVQAKANITKFQAEDDFFIYNETQEEVRRIAANSRAKLVPFTPKRENAAAAKLRLAAAAQPVFLAAKLFGIPKEKAQKTIACFKGLPHRLQFIGTKKGITFYEDSLATIPEATIAALDILGDEVSTLIVGGYNRGIPLETLARRILKSTVQTLILLPDTGGIVWENIEILHKKKGSGTLPARFSAVTMEEAVKLSYEHTPKGNICLLSPAASSFSMFRNYKERGEEFAKWVTRYGKKTHT